MTGRLRVEAEGEEGLRVTAEEPAERAAAALRLHRALLAAPPAEVLDWIHAPESVLVLHDCTTASAEDVARAVLALADEPERPPEPARFLLPVLPDGPDLGTVGAAVVRRLATATFKVSAVGGNGLPLLRSDGWDARVDRLPSPRTAVPAGAVGLAGDRVCVYPVVMPGGWRLVARTPLRLLDPTRADPVPWVAGDLLRFRLVDRAEAADLQGVPLRRETGPWTSS